MSYRLQLGSGEQAKQMNSFMEQWRLEHLPNLFLLPSDGEASLPTNVFLFSFHSPFLRSVFKSVDDKHDLTLSLPFTISCLEKLLELLSNGLVSADSRQQLVEVKEAINALGFSMDDSNLVPVTAHKRIDDAVKQNSLDLKSLVEVELSEAALP